MKLFYSRATFGCIVNIVTWYRGEKACLTIWGTKSPKVSVWNLTQGRGIQLTMPLYSGIAKVFQVILGRQNLKIYMYILGFRKPNLIIYWHQILSDIYPPTHTHTHPFPRSLRCQLRKPGLPPQLLLS